MRRGLLFCSVVAILSLPLMTQAAGAGLGCVCEDSTGNISDLSDSSGFTTDGQCDTACTADTTGSYVSGRLKTEADTGIEADQEQAATAEKNLANGACTCYCGDTKDGSKPIDGTYQTKEECSTECQSLSKTFVSCTTDASDPSSPSGNLLCWSADDCAAVNTATFNGKTLTGTWGADQPPECLPNQHYCYPTPQDIDLAVAIGPITTVKDIGSYINAFYTYALGAAALIAIVMIMIGGVQYILGAANPEMVGQAKSRMTNAVVGLILILGAYVILNTVNPYLVKFKTIQAPMLKPSLFLSGACDGDAGYIDQGYKVKPDEDGKTSCGDQGLIYAAPNGATMDSTCTYQACASSDALCSKSGSTYQCMTCDDAGKSSFISAGFTPSEASCTSLSAAPPTDAAAGRDFCIFGSSERTFYSVPVSTQTYCANVHTECDTNSPGVAAAVASAGSFCGVYNAATISVGGANEGVATTVAPNVAQDLCETNLCGFSGGCHWDSTANTCGK